MAVGTGFASRTAKKMTGAGKRVGGALRKTFGGSSGTEGLVRGLKGAWDGSGGGRSLARRAGIGAVAGGLTTGSISALRGNDFWEGAKSGAVVGAGVGAVRHGYKMGESLRGTGLKSNLASANIRGRGIGGNINSHNKGRLFSMNKSPTIRSDQFITKQPRTNLAAQAKASRAQLRNPGVSQQVKTLQRQSPTMEQAQSVVNRNYR